MLVCGTVSVHSADVMCVRVTARVYLASVMCVRVTASVNLAESFVRVCMLLHLVLFSY